MFFWGVGALMVLIGLAGMVSGTTNGMSFGLVMFIGGFALVGINKLVFKVRKVQREIDADEVIKRHLDKKKDSKE